MASTAFLPPFCLVRVAHSRQDTTPHLGLPTPLQPLSCAEPQAQERQNFLLPGTQNHELKLLYDKGEGWEGGRISAAQALGDAKDPWMPLEITVHIESMAHVVTSAAMAWQCFTPRHSKRLFDRKYSNLWE